MRAPGRALLVLLAGCGFSPHDAVVDAPSKLDRPPTVDTPLTSLDAIPPDWWNDAWSTRSTITIDSSLATTPLARFPVLVTLTPQNFDYARATGSGSDVRFVGSDGTELPHDVDGWVTGGSSTVWVGVDLPGSGSDPVITMYYGNPAAVTDEDPHDLFAMDVSVHHLSEFHDITGHGHDGVATGSGSDVVPTRAHGVVGGALLFDGATNALELGSSATPDYDFGSAMSLSVWLDAPPFDAGSGETFECFVCKGDSSWRFQREALTDEVDFGTTSGGVNSNFFIPTSTIDDSTWHHLGVVKDGSDVAIYIDGVRQTPTDGSALDIDASTSQPVVIGENLEASESRHFHGMLDELRITANALPDAWMAAEHATVVHSATFAVVGAIQTIR